MKFIAVIMLSVAMMASSAHAQEIVVDLLPDVPDVELVPLKKSDQAPVSGVLLPASAVATIVSEFEQFNERIKLEVDKVTRESNAKLTYEIAACSTAAKAEKDISDARVQRQAKYNLDLIDQVAKLEKNRPSRKVWFLLGTAAGVLVTGAAFFAIERAVN